MDVSREEADSQSRIDRADRLAVQIAEYLIKLDASPSLCVWAMMRLCAAGIVDEARTPDDVLEIAGLATDILAHTTIEMMDIKFRVLQ